MAVPSRLRRAQLKISDETRTIHDRETDVEKPHLTLEATSRPVAAAPTHVGFCPHGCRAIQRWSAVALTSTSKTAPARSHRLAMGRRGEETAGRATKGGSRCGRAVAFPVEFQGGSARTVRPPLGVTCAVPTR
jgi:hypothetical protein